MEIFRNVKIKEDLAVKAMFNQILKSVFLTGLMGLMGPNIAQARPHPRFQPQPYQVFQTPNPGIHRNIIIPAPQRIYSAPQRQQGYYDSYYPGYHNPYYRQPIYPSQKIIIIERDRRNQTPYYYRSNTYRQNGTPYYARETPYVDGLTPYYLQKVPYSPNHYRNNQRYVAPDGGLNFLSYPYYNAPNQPR
ncbi:MAG: hypothetical protein VKJ02_15800 [Snowella sp.]|nr:hypothetical protein [Snowella sp.]